MQYCANKMKNVLNFADNSVPSGGNCVNFPKPPFHRAQLICSLLQKHNVPYNLRDENKCKDSSEQSLMVNVHSHTWVQSCGILCQKILNVL